jgi:DNA polymerase-3 subunit delta'
MLNCESDDLEACGQCPSCKRMSKLEHANLQLVYPLKPSSSSKDTRDPFSGLKDEQIEEIQDEIQKKSENPYYKINLSKARSIPISFIRYIKKNIYLSSQSNGWKVVIILDAHLMTNQAANAFLKVLEEPPKRSVFILTTSKISELLPTIKSRCQQLFFPPLKNEVMLEALSEKELDQDQLKLIINLAGGSFSEATRLCEQNIDEIKKKTIEILRTLARWDKEAVYNYLDDLQKLYKDDSKAFLQLIRSINFWFRDAACLKAGADQAELIHNDQFTQIKNFVENYPDFRPDKVNKALENCIDLLERNVYINLVLIETFFKIREYAFKRKK